MMCWFVGGECWSGIAHNVQIQIEQLEDDMYGQAMCAAHHGVE